MQIYYYFLKKNKQNPDFLYIGNKVLSWYKVHGRNLPFRKTKDLYKIWICEIIFQQTRINQGLEHYNRFIVRFPDVQTLANAHEDDVLLYWKGLGYYSRAINLHQAAKQIITDFKGEFPRDYENILKLKGVGKYTAAAISSICFGEKRPAIDGNFYRVLSRIFADDFDISQPKAFDYFAELSLKMVDDQIGDFNQAIMDLGSEICKPKKPLCQECPVNSDCLAFEFSIIDEFPVKTKKVKVEQLDLEYYFVFHQNEFAVQQRSTDFIWKKLFEFPTEIPENFNAFIVNQTTIQHKLTHRSLSIHVQSVEVSDHTLWETYVKTHHLQILDQENWHSKSFPKPLENFINQFFQEN